MLGFIAPTDNPTRPLSAYYESATVWFVPEVAATHQRVELGPWTFGWLLPQAKPQDKRLNLYVVLPGKQNHLPNDRSYDNNLVVNSLTHEHAQEWDIFWCFILDPKLGDDLRSEREIIVAAHETFKPRDLFDWSDIPSNKALTEKLRLHALSDMRKFRHKDGSLPRLLILSAHLAVSASARAVPEPSTAAGIGH